MIMSILWLARRMPYRRDEKRRRVADRMSLNIQTISTEFALTLYTCIYFNALINAYVFTLAVIIAKTHF